MLQMTVLKLARNANSDGLINCLPQPGTVSQSILKSMPLISVTFIKYSKTGQFRLPGQHHRAAGRRAGAVFFARHLDSFILTQNSQSLPGLGTFSTVSSCTRTLQPSSRTGKKRGTATQTATN
jgi:hypothetical protein